MIDATETCRVSAVEKRALEITINNGHKPHISMIDGRWRVFVLQPNDRDPRIERAGHWATTKNFYLDVRQRIEFAFRRDIFN